MQPIILPKLSDEALAALDTLYHTTKHVRLRTRAQMILLAVEQRLVAHEIAVIVRVNEQTVRRWLKRYHAEGLDGLTDAPRPGKPPKVTTTFRERLLYLVRRRPRSLDLPYSLWTAQRLADVLAEETGIRVTDETVRRELHAADIVLSRPQHTMTSPDPEYHVKKKRSRIPATS